ncbi:hypothetical protein HQN89_32530 [Paenibacillus frigoriresistens]|uniref:hypothetical protein n=1 Tax=Paenibacillus alginolyticus TaxID=59839 RepID=UPI0015657958|nr:hypothetical protein [Paenibacillus frigoriresistens]NRF95566.1 hypothetical protein [Paenibacillus frigoriresistens]
MSNENSRKAVRNAGVTSVFGSSFLSALGIQIAGKIIEHIPTEIDLIRGEKHLAEELFCLDDESILLLEFQAVSSFDSLVKLMEFDILLYEQQLKQFRTIVVFGPDVNEAMSVVDFGAVRYEVQVLQLGTIDGDLILAELMEKVEQKIELKDEDLCRLMMLPFMRTSGERSRRAKEAMRVLDHLVDQEKKDTISSLMVTMARELLTDSKFDEVLEVLSEDTDKG